MPSPPRKQSTSPAVDGLVLPPDKAEYCSVVRLHSSESPVPSEALHAQPGHILAVVVRDGATKNKQEACLLVLKDQQDPRTLPVIVQVLPIYSSLKIDISQVKHQEKNAQPALLVKFSHNQTSICMTFPEKQAMLDIVAEVRRLHSIAGKVSMRMTLHL
ncbi:uncharacterized protein BYT42DRAFT_290537 [Radiomyces spectabilis]|uniref:uncharacterized protein n=1 Tax=Radiomyces spectabilis TaxID=64574 RepID=UPI0022207ACB|nr:uncharacterized protein BYT42DRAFT_290537 [Radiomyces spectabilis]KAI8381058.1 hypothetical protein BYT42DRAFT_290537 [Radiomyces spectabilis]